MNYQNLLQQEEASDPANEMKERIQQALEDKKREILTSTEGLTTPLITEGLRGLGKRAFSKVKTKVEEEGGETAKSVMKKLEEAKGDFEDGGMKKVLSRQVKNAKEKLQSKAESEIKKRLGLGSDEEEFKLQNLRKQAEQKARDAYQKQRQGTPKSTDESTEGTELSDATEFTNASAVETNIGKQSVGNLDKDIQDGLSKNPSTDEINDAILKQSNRNALNDLKSGKKVGDKTLGEDDMTSAQTEGGRIKLPKLEKKLSRGERKDALQQRQNKLNDKFSDLSDEDKSNALEDFRRAKSDTQTFRKSVKDPLTQQENEMGMKENIVDNYTERTKQLESSAEQATDATDTGAEISAGATGTGAVGAGASGSAVVAGGDDAIVEGSAGSLAEEDATTRALEEGGKDIAKQQAKQLAEKEALASGERKSAVEVEEMGGGPEDPITDILALILGGVGLYSGIKASEKAKANEANVPPPANVSYQFGVN